MYYYTLIEFVLYIFVYNRQSPPDNKFLKLETIVLYNIVSLAAYMLLLHNLYTVLYYVKLNSNATVY